MNFRIADSFQDSLARLTGDEQKAAKTTAFDLQMDPSAPGLSFHKLDRAKDKRFWSVRVNNDIRLIVHRDEQSLLLCYVDHHDKAYAWAERRKLETHPKTGAAQFVEIRETVKEIVVPVYVPEAAPPKKAPAAAPAAKATRPVLAGIADDELLGFGVPAEWLSDVKAATEDSLLVVASHLPAEAAEALLELATGGKPKRPVAAQSPSTALSDPFAHPDAQRRFRVVKNIDELAAALEFPWDKWTIFLHPEQRGLVERDFGGPARVSGSAGTGKTIVALHRAVHLARANSEARVLLTTFSEPLANALRMRLRRLVASEPQLMERIDVSSLPALGTRLHKSLVGPVKLATRQAIDAALREAGAAVPDHTFSLPFLRAEWEQVVDAWQLSSWEDYRGVARLGRKTRLPEAKRRILWEIFEHLRAGLRAASRVTEAGVFAALTKVVGGQRRVFDFAVVDEAQDLGVPHLRFLAALAGDAPNALFFAGDLGQRIFQQPFSWKQLGVDIRGRGRTLRVNYRTSHQIRAEADRLLGPSLADVDGVVEDRTHTVSVFNGPKPRVETAPDEAAEVALVAAWLGELAKANVPLHEVAVFVRDDAWIPRAQAAAAKANVLSTVLGEEIETRPGHVSIGVMHLGKGLEFRAVAVMACDDDVLPLQQRIESVGDDADLAEVYETERHLLYVACTRARDQLLVTGVQPASEFLGDLGSVAGVLPK